MSERRFTRVGEHRIHSLHAGTGPHVVLLHGLCGSQRWWRYTLPALTPRFRVHVPELIGFGRSVSAGPQPSIPAMADILVEWIRAMEIGDVRLVGHSMGGQIAIHIAAREDAPVVRLVLAAPAGIPRVRGVSELARLLAEVVPPRRWGAPGFLPTIAADVVRTGPRVVFSAARRLLEDDVRPLLSAIDAPTLLLWGDLDPLVPLAQAREMLAAIPDARLIAIEGAAHVAMADRPELFNRHVLEFLAQA